MAQVEALVLREMASQQHERELFQRAHEATKEAQRQGDEQLQAAVAASRIFYPIATPIRSSRWSLSFCDPRLEAVYWRQCSSSKFIPLMFELVLQLWSMKSRAAALDSSASRLLLKAGHTTVAACCITFMTMQLVISNWYQHNRGMLHCYFVIALWFWESIKVFQANDHLHLYAMIIQSVILSLLYRVPFCVHMRVRGFGLCCQALAASLVAKHEVMQLLLAILVSHVLGSAVAYVVDRRARSSFLRTLPQWLLDTATTATSGMEEAAASKQAWSVFYPEFLEKETAAASSSSSVGQRRALGGFAGGFGGVSSLKCSAAAPAAVLAGTVAAAAASALSSSSNTAAAAHSNSSAASSNDILVPDSWSVGNSNDGAEEAESQSSASSQIYPQQAAAAAAAAAVEGDAHLT